MGTTNHNAVIACTAMDEYAERARRRIEVFVPDELRHLFVWHDPQLNGHHTLVMMPDGSQEGWAGR